MNDKKVVLFDGTKSCVVINFRGKDKAFLTPIDYPNPQFLSNIQEVITSEVVQYTQEGSVYTMIETMNTLYKNSLFYKT